MPGSPGPNRRVEWSLTGPGAIVAVADSGRSGKKDRTSAVSYTELYDRSAKRGDGATTAVKAGQAWRRVSRGRHPRPGPPGGDGGAGGERPA